MFFGILFLFVLRKSVNRRIAISIDWIFIEVNV
jgi:hypothetical protein